MPGSPLVVLTVSKRARAYNQYREDFLIIKTRLPLLSAKKKTTGSALPSKNIFLRLGYGFLFLCCFAVYLRTLGPAFLSDDSAETIVAGFGLGIQHPPGYPVNSLINRLVGLIPLGGPAFRIDFSSSFLAALGVLLLAVNLRLILKNFISPGAAVRSAKGDPWLIAPVCLCAAFLLAFSKTYWEKAEGAKGGLYLLETIFFLALLFCLIRDEIQSPAGASPRWKYLAFFLFGIGLAHYWEIQVLLIPPFLVFLFLRGPGLKKIGDRMKTFAISLGLLATGLSPLLYLPLRSRLHPVLNLGAPDSYSLFKMALAREYYTQRESPLWAVLSQALQGSGSWQKVREILGCLLFPQDYQIPFHLIADMKIGALLFAAWGFGAWGRARGRKTLAFILVFFCALFFVYLPGFFTSTLKANWWLNDNFLLPLNGMAALGAGIGLFRFGNLWFKPGRISPRPWRLPKILLGVLVFVALPLNLVVSNFSGADQKNQLLLYDYGENLLKSLPRQAVFFAEGDEDYFSLYYFQTLEGQRPDVRMIPTFTLFEPWGVDQVERLHPELGLTASSMAFPDHFARIIYSTSEIVAKNKARAVIGFSGFDGAFHRFYGSYHPGTLARISGILLWLNTPPARTAVPLGPGGLRVRHGNDCPSNDHPSLAGLRDLYQKWGLPL